MQGRDLGEAGAEFFGQPVGQIRVLIIDAAERHYGDGFEVFRGAEVRDVVADRREADQGNEDAEAHETERAGRAGRTRHRLRGPGRLFLERQCPDDALRGQIEEPAKQQGDGQSCATKQNDGADVRFPGGSEGRENRIRDLDQNPRADEVKAGDTNDVPSLQFIEEAAQLHGLILRDGPAGGRSQMLEPV